MAKKTQRKTKKDPAPSGSEADICFVIMPFGGWLDTYYTDIYVPAITKAGLEPHRADDLFRPSTITSDIWTYTKRSKIVLADLTGKNPNVFYELGLAHALAKPAILVAESMEDVPFDLRSLRVITYNKNAPAWGEALRASLEASIAETIKAPAEAVLPAFLNLSDSTPRVTVTEKERDILSLRQEVEALRREIPSLLDSRRETNTDIGPRAAMDLIDTMLKRGTSADRIIATVSQFGPPRRWVEREIARRVERAEAPVFEDHAAGTDEEVSNPSRSGAVASAPVSNQPNPPPTTRTRHKTG